MPIFTGDLNEISSSSMRYTTQVSRQRKTGLDQAASNVLRFGENFILGGKYFNVIVCLKQIFLGTTKFGRSQKIVRELP